MKTKVKKYAIVLDTNVFGKANKYNFNKSKVTLCLNGLNDFANIDLFMPSIVYKELKKHIKDEINEYIEKTKGSFVGQFVDIKDIESFYDKKVAELDAFIKKYRIEIIDCEKHLNISEINDWYFNCKKPFSIEKPKEFPDAMTVSSCIHYFEENPYGEIIVVAADKDFNGVFPEESNFKKFSDIGSVLTYITGDTEKDYIDCIKYIKDNDILSYEDTYSFVSYDIHDDFCIDEIKYSIDNVKIIDNNKDENYIQVCVNCSLDVLGEFNIVNQDMSVYDNEDPDCSVYFYDTGEEITIDDVDVFITLYRNKKGEFDKHEITIVDDIVVSDYSNQLELRDF